ncbi:MAG: hypothetical protein MI919_19715, partial [Holophagales bacterium]|nr:hypothetical protein [Holophagales bacterium]
MSFLEPVFASRAPAPAASGERRASPRRRAWAPRRWWLCALLGGLLLGGPLHSQTEFTYQGEILIGGALGQAELDFMFVLFDALVGGNAVGSPIVLENVEVRDGLFTVQLDFGAVFDGTPLWLEIQVIEAGDLGPFQVLSPRRPLVSAPEASHAQTTA